MKYEVAYGGRCYVKASTEQEAIELAKTYELGTICKSIIAKPSSSEVTECLDRLCQSLHYIGIMEWDKHLDDLYRYVKDYEDKNNQPG